jgi:hypothetical protein
MACVRCSVVRGGRLAARARARAAPQVCCCRVLLAPRRAERWPQCPTTPAWWRAGPPSLRQEPGAAERRAERQRRGVAPAERRCSGRGSARGGTRRALACATFGNRLGKCALKMGGSGELGRLHTSPRNLRHSYIFTENAHCGVLAKICQPDRVGAAAAVAAVHGAPAPRPWRRAPPPRSQSHSNMPLPPADVVPRRRARLSAADRHEV